MPVVSRITVASICQYSFGRFARSPSLGLAGCTRVRRRFNPRSRIILYQVVEHSRQEVVHPNEYVDRERPRRDREEPVGRLEIPPAAMRRGSRIPK